MWFWVKFAPKSIDRSIVDYNTFISTFKWKWLNTILGNNEDGLLPDWWKNKGGTEVSWFFRNPICNMRFWKIVSTLPQSDTYYIGDTLLFPKDKTAGWFFTWQGSCFYPGFLYQTEKWGIWIGWKTLPSDSLNVLEKPYRKYGIGLACQYFRF